MLKYKDKLFNNRKELKDYLGGTYYYNKYFYSGEIEFINQKIASNENESNHKE